MVKLWDSLGRSAVKSRLLFAFSGLDCLCFPSLGCFAS